MDKQSNVEKHPAHPVMVLGICPDGHETEVEVAPMIAQVGSGTGIQCPKRVGGGFDVCSKYLNIKQVFGK